MCRLVGSAKAPMMTFGASTKDIGTSGTRIESLSSSCAVNATQAPVSEYLTPAPAGSAADVLVSKYVSDAALASTAEFVTLVPVGNDAVAPVVEVISPAPGYFSLAPAGYTTPTPVFELLRQGFSRLRHGVRISASVVWYLSAAPVGVRSIITCC